MGSRITPPKTGNVSHNPGRSRVRPFNPVPPHNTANGYFWRTRVTHDALPGRNRAAKRRYMKLIQRNGLTVKRKGES